MISSWQIAITILLLGSLLISLQFGLSLSPDALLPEQNRRLPRSAHPETAVGDTPEFANHKFAGILDFAHVGFPKCGTTFMQHHVFGNEDFFYQTDREICDLSMNDPEKLLSRFGSGKEKNTTTTGIIKKQFTKCPKDLETEYGLPLYEKYFPDMKFIVNVRHPVRWFESFYNYRLRRGFRMPPPAELIGPCVDDSPYVCSFNCTLTRTTQVCTDRTRFHHALSRLGKTPMNTRAEKRMLNHQMSIHSLSDAKVFILDVDQMEGEDFTLTNQLRDDIQQFLELEHALPPMKHVPSKTTQMQKDRIDICERKYKFIRDILIQNGAEASEWIQTYFLQSPDVYLSSRDKFIYMIDQWKSDPCDTEENN
mmetsp:Transcript_2151/g.3900  ORF Transcript_2151/g.3900 Transcript_2151/m.3900 type:complete len:366 (-) Transcript_2151:177-1274(-)|eukprot:CAMPEP_0198284432 /NCGR_PEP_ID=MMETSP1449-20131203/3906_1 /TAXON_ID=420275 /ORGANISM="Attheya septentrionalis, Strain CCMP2084" /LENGTH=365 /DNA_ID=CAMNT_0043981495 /DNA_START=2193 /DNA_END=3290 /DNA_ORIENTATION=+